LTERIEEFAKIYPDRIKELEELFNSPTNVYIDFANVINWEDKLGWRIGLKRLKQLFLSFDTVKEMRIYSGTLVGDSRSEKSIEQMKKYGYYVITKSVKIMKFPINISTIPSTSPDIIKQFIRQPLLKKLNIETIEFINARLKELNKQGVFYLEDKKCNFDVELGSDMIIDAAIGKIQNFILWSGDSDFVDPLMRLIDTGKTCIIFSTARKISRELNELRKEGLLIYDIQKIRNFICWPRYIDWNDIKSKKDSI